MLHLIDGMQAPNYTAVIDVEDLMAQMQTECNKGKITLSCGINPVMIVYH